MKMLQKLIIVVMMTVLMVGSAFSAAAGGAQKPFSPEQFEERMAQYRKQNEPQVKQQIDQCAAKCSTPQCAWDCGVNAWRPKLYRFIDTELNHPAQLSAANVDLLRKMFDYAVTKIRFNFKTFALQDMGAIQIGIDYVKQYLGTPNVTQAIVKTMQDKLDTVRQATEIAVKMKQFEKQNEAEVGQDYGKCAQACPGNKKCERDCYFAAWRPKIYRFLDGALGSPLQLSKANVDLLQVLEDIALAIAQNDIDLEMAQLGIDYVKQFQGTPNVTPAHIASLQTKWDVARQRMYAPRRQEEVKGSAAESFVTPETTELYNLLGAAVIANESGEPTQQYVEPIQKLVRNSALLHKTPEDEGGFTALHLAVQTNNPNIVRAIADKSGPRYKLLDEKDSRDRTPLELANKLKLKESIKALSKK